MQLVEGKYNYAKIFTNVVEEVALKQIQELCNQGNYSAPHGAGRLLSRTAAKSTYTVSEFKKQMTDVYTISVNVDTLDECPMAYKNMEDMVSNIGDTAEVVKIIKPIYNFKAGEA